MVVMPFKEEKLNNNVIQRIFSKDVLSEELAWHRDKKDRYVTVISGKGWLLQLDNCLPEPLQEGNTYEIPAYVFHRIKRGNTDLIVHIKES